MFQLVETLRINYYVNMINTKICCVILCVIMLLIILHPAQWNMCTKICQLLKVFNDATNTLPGVYYPTTNLFILETLKIVGAVYDYMSREEELKS